MKIITVPTTTNKHTQKNNARKMGEIERVLKEEKSREEVRQIDLERFGNASFESMEDDIDCFENENHVHDHEIIAMMKNFNKKNGFIDSEINSDNENEECYDNKDYILMKAIISQKKKNGRIFST